jgi:hypothetical protein
MDVLLLHALASAGMWLPSRCLAMAVRVTILISFVALILITLSLETERKICHENMPFSGIIWLAGRPCFKTFKLAVVPELTAMKTK